MDVGTQTASAGGDASSQGQSEGQGGPQGNGTETQNGDLADGGAGGDAGESLEGGGQQGASADAGGDIAGGPAGGGAQAGGPSAGDGLEGLDEQLEGSLEVFNQGMEGRRIVLASSLPAGGDSSGGNDGDQAGGLEDQTGGGPGLVLGGEEGGSGEDGTTVVAGLPGTASPGNQPGDNQREGDFKSGGIGGRVPPDVGDGSDDDVVARQIREAATNEPDPVLREKLWEEYRTYKSNAG